MYVYVCIYTYVYIYIYIYIYIYVCIICIYMDEKSTQWHCGSPSSRAYNIWLMDDINDQKYKFLRKSDYDDVQKGRL